MKIRPLGAELFHAERCTDMQLVVIFRDFANAPKKRNALFDDHTRPPLSVKSGTVSATNLSVRFGEKKNGDDDMHDPYTVRLQYAGI